MKTLSFLKQLKVMVLVVPIFLSSTLSQAQEITGQWNGLLSPIPGTRLRIVIHITKSDDGYTSTMDSPDQGVSGIAVATTTFEYPKLTLSVPNSGLSYEGEFKTDSIVGTFKQGALSVPLTLTRTPQEVNNRPQEPKPPYLYRSEEVTFENNTAGITLAGTLTMPATGANFTAVILITGSGPQNRDEELMGHKPFLVIADYLTRNGIAVLRYDDRGTAHSTGNFATATTSDFATDAQSAIAYLKTRPEINPLKIGLMGHSEGGAIAPMVAAQSNEVGFIIMLAGPGVRGDRLLILQEEAVFSTAGMPQEMVKETIQINARVFEKIVQAESMVTPHDIIEFMTEMKSDIEKIVPQGVSANDYIQKMAIDVCSPWMFYFLRYDPAPTLEKVKCPVLAVNGSKDVQILAKENLTAISAALKKGGNSAVTIMEFSNLNHLFQECITGSPAEYALIEQTFSPEVLKYLNDWILQQ